MHLKKGTIVWILDYPFGKTFRLKGKVVGRVGKDSYNVLLEGGLRDGDIVKYKYWKLYVIQ